MSTAAFWVFLVMAWTCGFAVGERRARKRLRPLEAALERQRAMFIDTTTKMIGEVREVSENLGAGRRVSSRPPAMARDSAVP